MKSLRILKEKGIDIKDLSLKNLQLMYDLLLIDYPNLQNDVNLTIELFYSQYNIAITEVDVLKIQDSTIDTDTNDLILIYNNIC